MLIKDNFTVATIFTPWQNICQRGIVIPVPYVWLFVNDCSRLWKSVARHLTCVEHLQVFLYPIEDQGHILIFDLLIQGQRLAILPL